MSSNKLTAETLELVKTAQAAASAETLQKSFAQPTGATTGLQAYDLTAPSQKLYPVLTPLRNKIPRVSGGFATQANWKAITAINVGNVRAGVSEGNRGGVIDHSMVERMAAYRGFGLENFVTFEAGYAAKGFEDVKALAVTQTLQAVMVQEELMIFGGNTGLKLGTTPTPTLIAGGSKGTLPSGSLSVVCVALGLQAYLDVAGANNGATGQMFNAPTAKVPAKITRKNADGSTDTFGGGSAQKSAAASVNVGAGQTVTAKVNAVRGAVAYAWFWGTAGTEKLGAVTTTAEVVITANATGTQNAGELPAEDCSTSHLEFDGVLTQLAMPDSGAYYADNKGQPLTTDGAGGVQEFEAAFVHFYNLYRLSPTAIYCHASDLVSLNKLLLGGNGTPLLRLTVDVNQTGSIRAGAKIGSYLNKVTGDEVDIVVHPNAAPGTYLFWSDRLPAYVQGITNLFQIRTRQDYYQLEWPLRSRRYEYGVYADEVLQGFFPPAFGLLSNVKTGV